MEINSIPFFVILAALVAVYVSLGKRQYKDPRPHVNRDRKDRYSCDTSNNGCCSY